MIRPSKGNVRVAIAGAGFISEYHISALAQVKDAETRLLVGRDAARTARRAAELGVAASATDWTAVVASPDVDAIIVATPDATHHRMAIDALQSGKAVMIQKPMAMTSAECRDILRAAQAASAPLTVSFMHRYFPEVRWLKTLLDGGELGPVHGVRVRNATPGADWADWFYAPDSVAGGVVMQLGVHGIDLVQHLLGPIESVAAAADTMLPRRRLRDGRHVESRLEDNVLARYRLASGTPVSHEMSYTELAGCDRFRLEVYAEKGTVWLRSERGRAVIFAPEITGAADWVMPDLPNEPLGLSHHRHWIDVVAGRSPPDDTGTAGLSSMLVAEAIYLSAQSGRTEPVVAPEGAN